MSSWIPESIRSYVSGPSEKHPELKAGQTPLTADEVQQHPEFPYDFILRHSKSNVLIVITGTSTGI